MSPKVRLLSTLALGLLLFGCNRKDVPGGTIPTGSSKILVKVMDALSNQPIGSARISLRKDGATVGADQGTAPDGTTTFANIPNGDGYKAFANNVPGYTPGSSPSIRLEADTEVSIPMTRSFQGAGLVAGAVKDNKTQLPLPGVQVVMVLSAGIITTPPVTAMNNRYRLQQVGINPVPTQPMSMLTDASGQFTFNNVAPGTYRLSYNLAPYPEQIKDNIVVTEGNSTSVDTVFMGANSNAGATGRALFVESGRAFQLDKTGKLVWSFPTPSVSAATGLSEGNVAVSDEQANQVWIVNSSGKSIWNMGSSIGLFSSLKNPGWVAAARDGKSFLIADTGNNRVIEIEGNRVVWQYTLALSRPRSATYTPTGNILIADTGNRRVIEINRQGQIEWSFMKDMQAPVHAVRSEEGNTVVTDAGYNRVIMLNKAAQPIWFYEGIVSNGAGSPDGSDPTAYLNRPRSTFLTVQGTLLIADTGNNRILEVDRNKQLLNTVGNLRAPLGVERL